MFENQRRIAENQERYKDAVSKSFESKEDIFAHIKRDENDIRKKIHMDVQEEIKKQIEEFNDRKSIEKIDGKIGDQLEKSVLGPVVTR